MDDETRKQLTDAIHGVLGMVPFVLVADTSTPDELFGDEHTTSIKVTSPPHQTAYPQTSGLQADDMLNTGRLQADYRTTGRPQADYRRTTGRAHIDIYAPTRRNEIY